MYGLLPFACGWVDHRASRAGAEGEVYGTFMLFAASMKAAEKSKPTTSSKSLAISKAAPPTAQPMSRQRPFLGALAAHCLAQSCGTGGKVSGFGCRVHPRRQWFVDGTDRGELQDLLGKVLADKRGKLLLRSKVELEVLVLQKAKFSGSEHEAGK